jgi:surfeit locus 1 family protein
MNFRLRPGLAIAAALAFAALCALGTWQLQRRGWKQELIASTQARLAAAPIPFDYAVSRALAGENMEYQPVYLDGAYANDRESFVFGTHDGAPGVYVFTPLGARDLSRNGRRFVYVNRGFAPQDFKERNTRRDGLIEEEIVVRGLFRSAEVKRGLEKWLAPENQLQDNLFFLRDPKVFAQQSALEVPSFYIDAFVETPAAAWPQGGLTRVEFPNRHLEYALTWFGLAATLLGVFAVYSLKRS